MGSRCGLESDVASQGSYITVIPVEFSRRSAYPPPAPDYLVEQYRWGHYLFISCTSLVCTPALWHHILPVFTASTCERGRATSTSEEITTSTATLSMRRLARCIPCHRDMQTQHPTTVLMAQRGSGNNVQPPPLPLPLLLHLYKSQRPLRHSSRAQSSPRLPRRPRKVCTCYGVKTTSHQSFQ